MTTKKLISRLFDVDAPMKSIDASAFIKVDLYEMWSTLANRSYKYAVATVEIAGHVLVGCGVSLKNNLNETVAEALKAWYLESGFDPHKNAASDELEDIIVGLYNRISDDI